MKKLIIVCDEKYRKYGDYLAQLISLNDDTDDKTVGPKDGEVVATVWLEKEYKANAAQLSSNQYILFIGQDKLIKEKSLHMDIVFSKYGMKYGWLGKQAMISVEKVVDTKQYADFVSYAQNYQKDIKQVMEKITLGKKNNVAAAVAALTIITPLAFINPIALAPFAVRSFTLNSKIKEQQYSCAVMKFYLDDLSKFLSL